MESARLSAKGAELILDAYGKRHATRRASPLQRPAAVQSPEDVAQVFRGVRNAELLLDPHLNAPFRGILLLQIDAPVFRPLASQLLPILARHVLQPKQEATIRGANKPPHPSSEAAPAPRWGSASQEAEELLERLLDPAVTDEDLAPQMRAWLRLAQWQIETYRNAPIQSPPPLDIMNPALDGLRPALDAALAATLRATASTELTRFYSRRHPG